MIIPALELSRYMGRPLELVQERCKTAPVELAWQWEFYKGNPLDFYRKSDLYLFDLTLYHDMILEPQGLHMWFRDVVKQYAFKKMLDVGGGNGDWTIHAVDAGCSYVEYMDVDGVMKNYAKWRFAQRGFTAEEFVRGASPMPIDLYNIGILTEKDELQERYDAIVCMDVFEHMQDPQPMIESIAQRTDYIFCNPDEIQYSWMYPQHISRFDLTPLFTKIDRYLWKRK